MNSVWYITAEEISMTKMIDQGAMGEVCSIPVHP